MPTKFDPYRFPTSAELATCLLGDRRAFRRRRRILLRRAQQGRPSDRELLALREAVRKSQALFERRQAQVPAIIYPPELPVSERREEVAALIRDHQVVVVCGETGSGKSTQLPKLCLELGRGIAGRIGHTQPRRIAARSLAARLSQELGTEPGTLVGYKVRFQDRVRPETSLKLMTDGILLTEIRRDRRLDQYDTLIIDEAHERSLDIDFLLGYLKDLLPQRPDLKLIVTSATIDPGRFAAYFARATGAPAPIIEISGRTYPVAVRYQPPEDEQAGERDEAMQLAIAAALDELAREGPGDVLVFLSGERAIRETAETLRGRRPPSTELLPLYARQGPREQARIFQAHGARRVILATNVAETSLTVPGIRYVIDPGFARISRYSHRGKIQRLPVERVSQAAANQRKGRCGRVAAGVCIRLYSEDNFAARGPFTEPEIRRTNLAAVILRMKLLGFGSIEAFPFLDPPDPRLIADGYRTLEELAALDGAGRLTTLGEKLARLPLDPRIGRILLASGDHHCLTELLIIAAALSVQDPRERPPDRQQAADQLHATFFHEDSDFLTFLNLWRFLEKERRRLSRNQFTKLCRRHFLSWNRVQEWRDIHAQLRLAMREMGYRENQTAGSYEEIHRALLTGLPSHIGCKDGPREYQGARNSRFFIHPGSGLFQRVSPKATPDAVQGGTAIFDRGERLKMKETGNHNFPFPRRKSPGMGFYDIERMSPKATPDAVQGGTAIFDRGTRLKMKESGNHIFPIPRRKSPGMGFCDTFFKGTPKWIVAAERVETSRHYGRIVARVQPAWIEQAGAHLVQRSYAEPHWQAESGQVAAYERITLYGLTIVPKRRVNYGPINPAEAREIFLRFALVEGDFETRAPFWRHNRELIEYVRYLEAKSRRRDILVDEEALYAFYAQRIPSGIYSRPQLETWLRRATRENPKLLHLRMDDLMRRDAEEITAQAFPDELPVGATRLPLTYRFDPGAAADGVTLTVPLPLINQISPQRCEWLVPGLLEERLVALLRGLPKPIRKTLVPIPETARQLVARLTPTDRPLVQAVAETLRETTGVAVPEDAWDETAIPEHLRMKFRLVDDQGRQVASGDDLPRLKRRYGRQGQQSFAAIPAQELERTGLRHWDFDTLPESLDLDRGGIRLRGYPALIDQGDSVAIRVLDSQASAATAMRAGLHRLLMLRLGSDLRRLRKNLPGLDRMRLQYTKAPQPPGRDESERPAGPVDLADELITLILDFGFLEDRPPIRDRHTFNARLEENRPRLAAVAGDVCALTERILARYQAIRRRLADITQTNWIASVKDMSGHLDALVFRGFLQQIPYARLQDYPRYLKALEARAEKLPYAAGKDRQHIQEMAPLQRKWRERAAAARETGRQDPRLEEIRWLLEELRISLFAQQIGTARPVSVKRIETRWRALGL